VVNSMELEVVRLAEQYAHLPADFLIDQLASLSERFMSLVADQLFPISRRADLAAMGRSAMHVPALGSRAEASSTTPVVAFSASSELIV
jgi:hypothetical protein